jgi:hypothetical protein
MASLFPDRSLGAITDYVIEAAASILITGH